MSLWSDWPDDPCDYEGLDGLQRDICKLRCEGAKWRDHMRPEVCRWLKKPWSFHLMTNLWVEACRGSAYFFGHVLMMATVLGVTINLALILRMYF